MTIEEYAKVRKELLATRKESLLVWDVEQQRYLTKSELIKRFGTQKEREAMSRFGRNHDIYDPNDFYDKNEYLKYGLNYETRSQFTYPERREQVKKHSNIGDKEEWERSHCLKCFGRLTKLEGHNAYTKKDHNCQDFCDACKKPAVGYKEIDTSEHVCGLSDDQLWFSYQTKVAGYKAGEEDTYLTTTIGSYRVWNQWSILVSVLSTLVGAVFLMAFLATGGWPFLAMSCVSGGVAIPSYFGIAHKEVVKAKVLDLVKDGASSARLQLETKTNRKAITK